MARDHSIVIQYAGDPLFTSCETCRGTGEVEAGFGDCAGREYCGECSGHGEVAHDLSWLATLAHNLAIAGGLCATYWDGVRTEFSHHLHAPWIERWRPGCAKPAPSSGKKGQ